MKFRCKNLLVTGGCGFIGSNFIDYILNEYNSVNVYNIDKLTYAGLISNTNGFNSNKRYKFIKGDICDTNLVSEIFKKFNIDGVINFAAESHVDNSIKNPKIFIDTNINGVFTLLDTSYRYWMSSPFKIRKKFVHARFHQISTDEVFGSISNGSFSESSPFKPNSPYSASKASADMLTRSFNKTFGLNTIITHSSNNFGPNQHKEKLIPMIINRYMKGDNIDVYGDGLNIRNWIYVKENCLAISKAFNIGESGETYNIGSDFECNNNQLIKKIFNLFKLYGLKSKSKIIYVNDRYGHDRRYSLNSSKMRDGLNWSQSNSFEFYLNNLIKKYI
jgi:dTDP-glucose 4,6-dehydratase